MSVVEGGNENPLLDSRFPDVSAKGRGYQLQAYDNGLEGWPSLRKITIWQTVDSLEQEFRDRAAALLQARERLENNSSNSNDDDDADVKQNRSMRTDSFADRPTDVSNVFDKSYDIGAKPSIRRQATLPDEKVGPARRRGNSVEDRVQDVSNVFDDDYDISKNDDDDDGHSKATPRKSQSSSSMNSATPTIAESKNNDSSNIDTPVLNHKIASGDSFNSSTAMNLTSPSNLSMRSMSIARPHHLPKMESLSKRLDQIRSEMGNEVSLSLILNLLLFS